MKRIKTKKRSTRKSRDRDQLREEQERRKKENKEKRQEEIENRLKTYSNYKKHSTKFLIAITPCGSISFSSQCWGGRILDKVSQQSGFLNLLEPGDVALADRGFTIEEDPGICGPKLEISAFTRGKQQLTQREVETSQQLSSVRIHVE